MFGDIWPLISVVIGILLLLSLIIFLKLNTFISLIVTSVVTAILLGMPLNKIMETIEAGNGKYAWPHCINLWVRGNAW